MRILTQSEKDAISRKNVRATDRRTTHCVRVNTQTPQDDSVVFVVTKSDGEEIEVVFFKVVKYYFDDDEADKEYKLLGFNPVDPYVLDDINEADPGFSYEHPNYTHWKNTQGEWHFASFLNHGGKQWIAYPLKEAGGGWCFCWWFAGVRKVSGHTWEI